MNPLIHSPHAGRAEEALEEGAGGGVVRAADFLQGPLGAHRDGAAAGAAQEHEELPGPVVVVVETAEVLLVAAAQHFHEELEARDPRRRRAHIGCDLPYSVPGPTVRLLETGEWMNFFCSAAAVPYIAGNVRVSAFQ